MGAADQSNPDEKTVNAGTVTVYIMAASVVVWHKSAADVSTAHFIKNMYKMHQLTFIEMSINTFALCIFPLSGLIVGVLGGIVFAGAVISAVVMFVLHK